MNISISNPFSKIYISNAFQAKHPARDRVLIDDLWCLLCIVMHGDVPKRDTPVVNRWKVLPLPPRKARKIGLLLFLCPLLSGRSP